MIADSLNAQNVSSTASRQISWDSSAMGCTESLSKNKKYKKSLSIPPAEIRSSEPNAVIAANSIRSLYPARVRSNTSFHQPSAVERTERPMIENPTNGSDKLLWLVNLKANISKKGLADAKGLPTGTSTEYAILSRFPLYSSFTKTEAEQLTGHELYMTPSKLLYLSRFSNLQAISLSGSTPGSLVMVTVMMVL